MDRLRDIVLSDIELQSRLLAIDPASFVTEVVAIAAEHDMRIVATDVESALVDARRTWLERWI
jgi:hypothetical protein